MPSGFINPRGSAAAPLTTTPDPTSQVLLWLPAGGNAMATNANIVAQVLALGTAALKQTLRLGSAFSTSTGTTPLQVTDLTFGSVAGYPALVAGTAYAFEAVLSWDADATGGHKWALGGTATATAVEYHIMAVRNDTLATVITSRQTALAGAAGAAGGTAGLTVIRGSIVVNAGGTFGPQFSRNAGTGTSTVRALSTFRVWPT